MTTHVDPVEYPCWGPHPPPPAGCACCEDGLQGGESWARCVLWCVMDAWWDDRLLPWCVGHAPDGVDPLPAAWAECDGHFTMREVLLFGARRGSVRDADLNAPGHRRGEPERDRCGIECRACADHLRVRQPAPTLAELLAARARFPGGPLR